MPKLLFFVPHASIAHFKQHGFTVGIVPAHPFLPVAFVLIGRRFANQGKPRLIIATDAAEARLARLFQLFFGVPYLAWDDLDIPPCPPLRFQGPEVDLRARLRIPKEKKLVAWLGSRPFEAPGTALLPPSLEYWEMLDNADLAVCETAPELYRAIAAGLPVVVPETLRKTVELHDLGVVVPELTREAVAAALPKLDLSPERRKRSLDLHARYFNFEAQFPKVLARLEKFPDL